MNKELKFVFGAIAFSTAMALAACSTPESRPVMPEAVQASPVPTTIIPKDGNYNGTGVITKIDLKLGSVELKHENIEGLMPAMQMEFFVIDTAQLKGLAVGDKADFVIEYKQGSEKISSITKIK